MQKQNQFWIDSIDGTQSSLDPSDLQNNDQIDLHTYTPVLLNNNDNNNTTNYGNDTNINISSYDYDIINNINDNNNIINNNNNNNYNRLVPSQTSNINDNSAFHHGNEDSIFHFEDFHKVDDERFKNNNFEYCEIDDDKYFQPIPPSPFMYEEEGTEDCNDISELEHDICKPSIDETELNSLQVGDALPSLVMMDEYLNSFSPLTSSIGFETFEGNCRNDERDIERSFNRSESFSSPGYSECNKSRPDLDEDNDSFGFLSNIEEEENENCLVIDETQDLDDRITAQTNVKNTMEKGDYSNYDTMFGDNLYCNDEHHEQNYHCMASSRKRIASGDVADVDNSPSHSKIPRRCSSLGNEQYPNMGSISPNAKYYHTHSRSVPILPSNFSESQLSENTFKNANNQMLDMTMHLAGKQTMFPSMDVLHRDINNNGTFHDQFHSQFQSHGSEKRSKSGAPFSKSHSLDDNSAPCFSTNNNESPGYTNGHTTNVLMNNINNFNNNDYAVRHTQFMPSNDNTSNASFKCPSQTPSLITSSHMAANHYINSHPFTVRSSSASVYNDIMSSSFDTKYCSANDASLPGTSHSIQAHSDRNTGQDFNHTFLNKTLSESVPSNNDIQTLQSAMRNTSSQTIASLNESATNWNNRKFVDASIVDGFNSSTIFTMATNSCTNFNNTNRSSLDSCDNIGIAPINHTTLGNSSTTYDSSDKRFPSINNTISDSLEIHTSSQLPITTIRNIPESSSELFNSNNAANPTCTNTAETSQESTVSNSLGAQSTTPAFKLYDQNNHDVKCETTDDPALEKAYKECLRTGKQTHLIKEELKRKIMYKRCVQGIQEVPSDPPPSSPSNQLTEEEQIKKIRRQELNRIAAAKMRKRRKLRDEELNSVIDSEEEKRERLKAEIGRLQDKKEKMLFHLSRLGIRIET